MRVSTDAANCFITLYIRLLYYAGQQRDVLPPALSFSLFLAEPWPLIDDFMTAHGDTLSVEEQQIVAAWTCFLRGTFVVCVT